MMMLLYTAFNPIDLAKKLYLVVVVLALLPPLIKLWKTLMKQAIDLTTSERPDFVGCLSRLFKDIVLAVEENDAVLHELRGEDGVAYAIIELQEE